jgi:hypothetical protein
VKAPKLNIKFLGFRIDAEGAFAIVAALIALFALLIFLKV